MNIGSSEDIKPEKKIERIIKNFNIKNISNSSAKFSDTVMKSLNSDVLKIYNFEEIYPKIKLSNNKVDLKKLWIFSKNNIEFLKDIEDWLKTIDTVIEIEKYKRQQIYGSIYIYIEIGKHIYIYIYIYI